MQLLYILASFFGFFRQVATELHVSRPHLELKYTGKGTTPHLKEIFLGRCWEFQIIIHPIAEKHECQHLWELFFNAFAFQDPCQVSSEKYHSFIEEIYEPMPENKTMLWSGTYMLVKSYTEEGRRYVALADTMLGYMVDGAVWCGSDESPGYNSRNCPKPFSGECGIKQIVYDEAYWGAVSEIVAKTSSGVVTLMLNGTRRDGQPAFSNKTFFSKYELPNLNPKQVHTLRALVVHDVTVGEKETCSTDSIPSLKELVEAKGFKYECLDDPKDVVHLLCVDDVDSPKCQFANSRLRKPLYKLPYDNRVRVQPGLGLEGSATQLSSPLILLLLNNILILAMNLGTPCVFP